MSFMAFTKKTKTRNGLNSTFITIFTAALLALFLLPFLYMMLTSLKTKAQITVLGSPIYPAAVPLYNYKGENGQMTVSLGFPDYTSKKDNAEFEINISSLSNDRILDAKDRRKLKSKLLSEMDKQKSIVYNNYPSYINTEIK